MSNELLDIDPIDLQFPFELKKQISSSLYLANKTDDYVAFKVKTTNPKKYCVRPNTGVVLPRSSSEVLVTMQAQKEAPADMQCKDKFLLQCVVASPGATAKDVTPEMFSKEAGHRVEETKLRVVYVDPPQPPSPVREGSEEGSSPRASVSDSANVSDFTTARALITRLTEEKKSALQLNKKLQQELEQLKRESKRSQSGGGIPFMYVLLVGLIGLILGYIMTRT
uniref:MSP domain-containing protein n=1 Tax=Brassica campestris TaxID=3711 RepID=M4CGI0_BRACM